MRLLVYKKWIKIKLSLNLLYLVWRELELFSVKILWKTTSFHTKLNKENNFISHEAK